MSSPRRSEMQKIGTSALRMYGDQIMQIAEALYSRGILSYPRTETQVFDEGLELRALIEKQVVDPA
ncbi:hypothetical protein SmJEL517_g01668 [Synchytrium microbalum]|uniref:DNA topoisomerase n=1 Tax=Synchytrium microbalum TaxID=1806994 RepID=A0A507CAR4_9FUNG|nr:uncharacterized protein SmJEL517_g01668 [Synchytrium microbalum]TPX36269.1 hypothetical protein SmJEL517_g01668 [Synchytrium microbalum]